MQSRRLGKAGRNTNPNLGSATASKEPHPPHPLTTHSSSRLRWWVKSTSSRQTLTLIWSRMIGQLPRRAARRAASEAWETLSGWTFSIPTCCRTAGTSAATCRLPPPPPPPASPLSTMGRLWRSLGRGLSLPRPRRPPRHPALPRLTPRWTAGCPSLTDPAS